jgi:hypothetical protein
MIYTGSQNDHRRGELDACGIPPSDIDRLQASDLPIERECNDDEPAGIIIRRDGGLMYSVIRLEGLTTRILETPDIGLVEDEAEAWNAYVGAVRREQQARKEMREQYC